MIELRAGWLKLSDAMIQVGTVSGTCPRCGKTLSAPRPADVADCDCWQSCPFNHGDGLFATSMEPYTPDLSPDSYEKDDLNVVMICNRHSPPYKSKQKPVEVRLT